MTMQPVNSAFLVPDLLYDRSAKAVVVQYRSPQSGAVVAQAPSQAVLSEAANAQPATIPSGIAASGTTSNLSVVV